MKKDTRIARRRAEMLDWAVKYIRIWPQLGRAAHADPAAIDCTFSRFGNMDAPLLTCNRGGGYVRREEWVKARKEVQS